MGMREARLAVVFVALPFLLSGALLANSRDDQGNSPQGGTFRLLTQWGGDDETALASLFATGDTRIPDLISACRSQDQDRHGEAYLLLYLIGSPEARACAADLHADDDQIAVLATADSPTSEDFGKLERVFTLK